MSKIQDIHARQILDSRGHPTLEVEVWTQEGDQGRASVPAGASVGRHEALELRDTDNPHYAGRGVKQAIQHVKGVLKEALVGHFVFEQEEIDQSHPDSK